MMKNKRYEIRIDGIFESAHYLYDYFGPGKNEPLHGHTYQVELFVASDHIQNGISVDFMEVRGYFEEIVKKMDHTCLNAHAPFDQTNPTAENIAEYFFDQLRDRVPGSAAISKVTVWEGPKNHATYYPQ